MSALATLLTALSSLGANKLRAGLTLLGIVIGVTSVISLMAIGKGAQESITSRIESLGTNLLFVRPGATTQGGISSGLGSVHLSPCSLNIGRPLPAPGCSWPTRSALARPCRLRRPPWCQRC